MADEVVLLPIYPARELPIEGVTAELIARELTAPYRIVELEELAATIEQMKTDVVVSFGAGSIDRQTEELAAVAEAKCR
jgi:UDP-N-acetylmuramate--alanine ligase